MERAKEQHGGHLRRQEALARFGELAIRSDNLDDVLHEACQLVGDALGTDLAKVIEIQDNGGTLFVKAGVGWPEGIVGNVHMDAHGGFAEEVAIRTGNPVVSSDLFDEKRFACADFIRDAGVRSLVNVVILGSHSAPPYGILEVDSREVRHFTPADIEFLRNYANLLALTVQRLRVLSDLRESEDHHRAAVELNPQITWTADPQGRINGFSDRWLEFTGMSREQALGTGWMRAPHPEDLPAMQALWKRALATGEPYDVEARVRNADRGYVWLRVRAFARRDAQGRILRWYGTTEDIEARKRLDTMRQDWNRTLEGRVAERTLALEREQQDRVAAEDKLRQSQKMEAVGQLTGGLAHDFNNLLTGIIGALGLLKTRLGQGRVSEADRYIEAANASAERAAALTHRLLAFSRRQTLDPKPTHPNVLVAGMEELLRRTAGPSITVGTVLSDDVTPVLCDPNQLENALLNLAINARDAMPDGGTLRIETADVVVDAGSAVARSLAEGRYAVVSVVDTGTGMAPEVAARAFDPFYTTKPLGVGTGLGLSMVYGFAQQSGGQASIRTGPGVGTTVSLFLPSHAAVLTTTEVVAVPAQSEGSEIVLVVDDEAVVRLLIVEALRELGYRVVEAADGAAGLLEAERQPHLDLLITDVGLPGGMNGRQLADAVRVRRPDLKVLFITGFAETAVFGNRQLEGGMQVMTKPFAMDSIATRVRQMFHPAH